jgi:hypothetical protein
MNCFAVAWPTEGLENKTGIEALMMYLTPPPNGESSHFLWDTADVLEYHFGHLGAEPLSGYRQNIEREYLVRSSLQEPCRQAGLFLICTLLLHRRNLPAYSHDRVFCASRGSS